jgi:hypothetical protein
VALAREAVDVEAGEGAEGVAAVHLHVVLVAAEAAATSSGLRLATEGCASLQRKNMINN